jgi:hypothetical protein
MHHQQGRKNRINKLRITAASDIVGDVETVNWSVRKQHDGRTCPFSMLPEAVSDGIEVVPG